MMNAVINSCNKAYIDKLIFKFLLPKMAWFKDDFFKIAMIMHILINLINFKNIRQLAEEN